MAVLSKGFVLFLSCCSSVCYSGKVRISSNWELGNLHPWEARLLLGRAGQGKILQATCRSQNPSSAGVRASSLINYSRLVLELFMFCPRVRKTWKHYRAPKSSVHDLFKTISVPR